MILFHSALAFWDEPKGILKIDSDQDHIEDKAHSYIYGGKKIRLQDDFHSWEYGMFVWF